MKKIILILLLLLTTKSYSQFDPLSPSLNNIFSKSHTWLGTQTFDSVYYNVLHSRTGSSNIFTNGTNGRRLNISNTSAEDSMRIQITTLGNGGLIINKYGAVYVGNAGNADANDSINFKVALNNTYWRFAQAWTSNGQSGDATTGIGALLPNNADSIIFRGLTGLNTGKYNFIGGLYNNKLISTGSVNETKFREITIAQDTSALTDHTIKLNTTSNGVTLVLLPASQCTGQVLEIIFYDATNSGGISISGGATFSDGNTEVNFSSLGDFVVVKSDGTKWIILSYKVV